MVLLQEKKSMIKIYNKNKQKGGNPTSKDLLDRFRGITNAINCIEKFSYYETAFIELQRILKVIQTQTSDVLTLTMEFPSYDELHDIFPNNKATTYGYLLHSFRKNYVYLLEKYTQQKDSDKKVKLDSEIQKFYKSYMFLFMYFFLEYLTDKEKKHSIDFEHNTQLMCSEFPKLIQDIQEYLKKVIPDKEILATLDHICTPVTKIELEGSNEIPIGTFLSNSNSKRKSRRKSPKMPRLNAWESEDEKQHRIEIGKNNRVIRVPITRTVPDQFIDEDGNVLFPFSSLEPQFENRLQKPIHLRRRSSSLRSRSPSLRRRSSSRGGTKKQNKKRKRKTRKIV